MFRGCVTPRVIRYVSPSHVVRRHIVLVVRRQPLTCPVFLPIMYCLLWRRGNTRTVLIHTPQAAFFRCNPCFRVMTMKTIFFCSGSFPFKSTCECSWSQKNRLKHVPVGEKTSVWYKNRACTAAQARERNGATGRRKPSLVTCEPNDTRKKRSWCGRGSLYSAGLYAPANNTGTIAATGHTPHTAKLVNTICSERFHGHFM